MPSGLALVHANIDCGGRGETVRFPVLQCKVFCPYVLSGSQLLAQDFRVLFSDRHMGACIRYVWVRI